MGRAEHPSTSPSEPELVVEGVHLTSPGRVYFPRGALADAPRALTKADLAAYYLAVRDRIEPHIVGRPVMLRRCPRGVSGECFYQQHPDAATPEAIGRIVLEDRSGSSEYMLFDSFRSVIAAVAIGALELHIWACRADRPERPDRMVFDLDPADDVDFSTVKEAAVELAEHLEEAGLTSFVMTTGRRGLHLVVPLAQHHDFGEVRVHARAWARRLAHERPERYTDQPSKTKRTGRIYIDVLRNGRGATAICPYSTRARPGATVAMPIDWEELETDFGPDAWSVETVVARLAENGPDPWVGYFDLAQHITRAAWAAVGAFH